MSEQRFREYLDYAIGIGILLELTLGGLILVYLLEGTSIGASPLIGGYWTGIISTVIGGVLTIVILDKRNENRATRRRKEELILQMGSSDNGLARGAVALITHEKWLYDGSLQDAEFRKSNLQEAPLTKANLSKAKFIDCQLQKAHLEETVLDGAVFYKSELKNAALMKASLKGANFTSANLWGAVLHLADLRGAILANTNLQGAELYKANLEGVCWHNPRGLNYGEYATLPDGKKWKPERDMREFTHPDEWRAEQAKREPGEGDIMWTADLDES